ncbi:MAG: manganese efflux pump MntP family protein [Oscillospiraceae bacterium]|nr:manganese efflux pump MntP family protein [Oscillospiraceae bacterium]
MSFIPLLLLAVGLAMDAFAVAVCKGLKMKRIDLKYAFLIAGFFGVFQAVMPLLGWLLGKQFQSYITSFDHWIAFILLAFIGGQMIWEAFHSEPDDKPLTYDLKELSMLAVATSIDALAVGVTFAFLDTDIWQAVLLIGVVTFILSLLGVRVGNRFGVKYKSRAELFGGVILVLIGCKILLEHLGILNF